MSSSTAIVAGAESIIPLAGEQNPVQNQKLFSCGQIAGGTVNMQHADEQRSAVVTTARAVIFSLTLAIVTAVAAVSSQAQTFSVLHNFSGGNDGGGPFAGVTVDRGGNLYGTTQNGGTAGFGVVYRLKRSGSGWLATTLHSFAGGRDGSVPSARVVFGPDGSLYGITYEGGGSEC